MSWSLYIDPGTNLGVALFYGNELVWLFVYRKAVDDLLVVAESLREVVSVRSGGRPVKIVCEHMVVYEFSKQKGDPNDLIKVSHIGAFVAGYLRPDSMRFVTPREWKGNVPKAMMQRRIEKRLTQAERFRAELHLADITPGVRHNAWDATGIGLWDQGRLR